MSLGACRSSTSGHRHSFHVLYGAFPPFDLRSASVRGLSGWFGDLRHCRRARRRSIAAIVLLVAARFALAFAKSDMTQARTGFAFAAPAAVAGYHAVHDIAVANMPQRAWQLSVSLFGAAIIATTFRIQWSRACR